MSCLGQNGFSSGQRIPGPQPCREGAATMPLPGGASTRAELRAGARVIGADVVSALPMALALSIPVSPSCSYCQHPPPSPLLPGARVSQDSWKCPEWMPPGTAPITDPDGRENIPDSGPSGGTTLRHFYTSVARRTFYEDGNVLYLCCPVW